MQPEQLPPLPDERIRAAVESPVRRQILRALHDSPQPLSGRQLLGVEGLDSNLSTVTYHALVLADAGAVEEIAPAAGDPGRAFRSTVDDDERAAALLAATAQADREYLAGGAGRRAGPGPSPGSRPG